MTIKKHLIERWKELKQIEESANSERKNIEREIASLCKSDIDAQLDQDYGTGTAHITVSDKVKVTLNYPKKVKWDKNILSNLWDAIKDSGQNPEEYIDRTLSVSETRYKNMPSVYRGEFEAARTVQAGNPTFNIKEID